MCWRQKVDLLQISMHTSPVVQLSMTQLRDDRDLKTHCEEVKIVRNLRKRLRESMKRQCWMRFVFVVGWSSELLIRRGWFIVHMIAYAWIPLHWLLQS